MNKVQLSNKYAISRGILGGMVMVYTLYTINWLEGVYFYVMMSLLGFSLLVYLVAAFRVGILGLKSIIPGYSEALDSSFSSAVSAVIYSIVIYTLFDNHAAADGFSTYFCVSLAFGRLFENVTTLLNK